MTASSTTNKTTSSSSTTKAAPAPAPAPTSSSTSTTTTKASTASTNTTNATSTVNVTAPVTKAPTMAPTFINTTVYPAVSKLINATRGEPTCVLDRSVVDKHTIQNMSDIGLSFFANLCGRNRGAFVLNPSDGHTWGCTSLPPSFPVIAGLDLSKLHVQIKDATAISTKFADGNLTATQTISLLDSFIKAVYFTTANKQMDPYACQVNGLARLQCDDVNTIPTVRAVTLTGLFSNDKKKDGPFSKPIQYTSKDFKEMKNLGLNTVQIPVPAKASIFDESNDSQAESDELKSLLEMVRDAKLQAILVLKPTSGSKGNTEDSMAATMAAAQYASNKKQSKGVVFGITLPSKDEDLIQAARSTGGKDLNLLVPINPGDIQYIDFGDDPNVYASLDLSHTSTIGDIASSTSEDDRMKLFYHESMACIQRSPFEYSKCYKRTPIFVSSGFDLSIDDCILQDMKKSSFIDYGQCKRFDETVGSGWWHRHRLSFAKRQLFSYEQGTLGWSYAAWKLDNGDSDEGVIDEPAKLLSFRDVAKAGLMPSLTDGIDGDITGQINDACLNSPVSDFVLGDRTLAPTPAPLDCGNGWVDPDTGNCTYWIPPAPTAKPTLPPVSNAPTVPCMECPVCETTAEELVSAGRLGPYGISGVGFIVGVVLTALFYSCFNKRRRTGYTEVPSAAP